MVSLALCFAFGTEYVRLSVKYRGTDFSGILHLLRGFIYAFMMAMLAAVVLQALEYFLGVPRLFP
jgi:hypothetical protein